MGRSAKSSLTKISVITSDTSAVDRPIDQNEAYKSTTPLTAPSLQKTLSVISYSNGAVANPTRNDYIASLLSRSTSAPPVRIEKIAIMAILLVGLPVSGSIFPRSNWTGGGTVVGTVVVDVVTVVGVVVVVVMTGSPMRVIVIHADEPFDEVIDTAHGPDPPTARLRAYVTLPSAMVPPQPFFTANARVSKRAELNPIFRVASS